MSDVIKPWRVLSRRKLVESRWVTMYEEDCINDRGVRISPFYLEERPDFAMIVAFDDEERLLVEEQYRHGIKRVLTEIPAGMIEAAENAASAAHRELLEETGYEADEWRFLFKLAVNANDSDRHAHIFMATGLHKVSEQRLDETEHLVYRFMERSEWEPMLRAGAFEQSFTTAALYRAMEILDNGV